MRKATLYFAFLMFLSATGAYAQFGKFVPIPAGSPQAQALDDISAATDPAAKLTLIDQFAADFGKGDMEILADDAYVNYYLSLKNDDKAMEYGEKLWVLDPENLQNGVNLVRAAAEKGDAGRAFEYGEKCAAILQRYHEAPAPPGREADEWASAKAQKFEDQKDNISYIQQVLFTAAYRTAAPAVRADLLVKFAKMFPDSTYAPQALPIAATSYQMAQQYPKMLELANGVLAKDPNDIQMLLLLADYYSDKGEQLDKAEADARKSLTLLGTAKKPEAVSDEDWQKQISVQKGLALTALGQINIQKNDNLGAVDNLRAAAPLLKSDPVTYAHNEYRLGFALLNLKRVPEARVALAEAANINSPYRALAQDKLKSLPPVAPKKKS